MRNFRRKYHQNISLLKHLHPHSICLFIYKHMVKAHMTKFAELDYSYLNILFARSRNEVNELFLLTTFFIKIYKKQIYEIILLAQSKVNRQWPQKYFHVHCASRKSSLHCCQYYLSHIQLINYDMLSIRWSFAEIFINCGTKRAERRWRWKQMA